MKLGLCLAAVIICSIILSIPGMNWGRMESWNPDDMGLRPLFNKNLRPFEPLDYHKPPFHTYLNYFLAELPAELLTKTLDMDPWKAIKLKLLFSRCLTIAIFIGSVGVMFAVSTRIFSRETSCRLVALYATSAGMLSFTPFLTADIPLLFWMLIAFYLMLRAIVQKSTFLYCAAGLTTGIAAATKYNGIVILAALAAGHAAAGLPSARNWKERCAVFCRRDFILANVCAALGFLAANPYAILDSRRFIADFTYNYIVTPSYDGITHGTTFLEFVRGIPALIGLPMSLLCLISIAMLPAYLLSKKIEVAKKTALVMAAAAALIYFIKFGSFARMETRFVLPVIPYVFLLGGLAWEHMKAHGRQASILFIAMLAYNIACCAVVGWRFGSDPRMQAQDFVSRSAHQGDTIVSTYFSPHWDLTSAAEIKDVRLPTVSGRFRQFKEVFRNQPLVQSKLAEVESEEEGISEYSSAGLARLKPDYVAVNSLYYSRFLSGGADRWYPELRDFFAALLAEQLNYRIIFDRESPRTPLWAYPREIDFLDNRMTILLPKPGQ